MYILFMYILRHAPFRFSLGYSIYIHSTLYRFDRRTANYRIVCSFLASVHYGSTRVYCNFTRYILHYPTIGYKERCAFCLYHRRGMKNIKLFFKSFFSSHLSNDVAALLSDHEPERLLPSQSGSLFYLRLERFKRSWPLK